MSPSEQTRMDKQGYFLDAADAYSEAMVRYQDSDEAATAQKVTVARLRDDLEDMEAEALVNGGMAGQYIDASTEAKRKAQLRIALKQWPEYQAKKAELDSALQQQSSIEAQRDRAANEMSLNKRRMDAYVAAANRASAVLSIQSGNGRQHAEQRGQTPAPAWR